jgi:uncharacterized protein (DUF2225 family)
LAQTKKVSGGSSNAIIFSRVECPVCGSLNEFETVKADAYSESGRDADFCPTGIKWSSAKYQHLNPLAFFVATCPNCFYSREFTNDFRDWKGDKYFISQKLKWAKKKHLEQLGLADSVIKKLGSVIDLTNRPNESAVIKLLLAIYDELLLERPSYLDLGRWYLRVAWIFRDLRESGNPNADVLKKVMSEVESRYNHLCQTIESLQEQSAIFKKHIQAQFESDNISGDLKSQMLPFRDRFSERIRSLDEGISSSMEQLKETEKLLEEYKAATMGNNAAFSNNAADSFESFASFLHSIKSQWDGVVINEMQAIAKAIDYYKESLSQSNNGSTGNQQIQASYLIAELSRRIGRFGQAREYFNSTIKFGQAFIQNHNEDKAQTALARKILELAIEQNKTMVVQAEFDTQKLPSHK